MYTIGQVSALFHLPVSTLRYYDKQGLFPNMQRSSGIRQFGERELEALRVMECLKKTGLEIREIKQFIDWCTEGAGTYDKRKALFEKQKETMEKELLRMQQVLDMLKFKCWYYDQAMEQGSEEPVQAMIPDGLPAEVRRAYENAHRQREGQDGI